MFIFMLVYLIMFLGGIIGIILTPIYVFKFLIEQVILFNNEEYSSLSKNLMIKRYIIIFNMFCGNLNYVKYEMTNYEKDRHKLNKKLEEMLKID